VKIRFTADGDDELAHAVSYYDRLSVGLGAEFVAEVVDGLARIEEYPEAGSSSAPV